MSMSIPAWSPSSGYPTTTPTSLKTVASTAAPALMSTIRSAYEVLQTITYIGDGVAPSQAIRGAEASLAIISAQNQLATATASSVQAEASQAIAHAMYNLKQLAIEENLYGFRLSRPGNVIYLVVFGLIMLFNIAMLYRSRYHWYNVTFICGYALEFIGFLGRVLAFGDNTNINYYIMQYTTLTLSPAFIMGGIYFIFAQNVTVHGREYSVLKPMWYSYFFLTSDICSLVVQGIGGGMASAANKNHTDLAPGTWTMFGGVLFQVVAMSVFLLFWFEYTWRLFFRHADEVPEDSPYKRKTVLNYLKLMFNVKSARAHKDRHLEVFYDRRFGSIRERRLVGYYPLVITVTVVVIYIRCVYRVVELKQGFSGYLVSHEVFLLVLDAAMIAIAGLAFVPFHPMFVFGRNNVLKLASVRKNVSATAEDKESFSE